MNKYFVRYIRSESACSNKVVSTIVNISDEDMVDLDLDTFEIAIQKTYDYKVNVTDILTINKL